MLFRSEEQCRGQGGHYSVDCDSQSIDRAVRALQQSTQHHAQHHTYSSDPTQVDVGRIENLNLRMPMRESSCVSQLVEEDYNRRRVGDREGQENRRQRPGSGQITSPSSSAIRTRIAALSPSSSRSRSGSRSKSFARDRQRDSMYVT